MKKEEMKESLLMEINRILDMMKDLRWDSRYQKFEELKKAFNDYMKLTYTLKDNITEVDRILIEGINGEVVNLYKDMMVSLEKETEATKKLMEKHSSDVNSYRCLNRAYLENMKTTNAIDERIYFCEAELLKKAIQKLHKGGFKKVFLSEKDFERISKENGFIRSIEGEFIYKGIAIESSPKIEDNNIMFGSGLYTTRSVKQILA